MENSQNCPMRVLFLLVGRGGSRSVKHKNLKTIKGRSLLAYKAISAKQSRYCSRLIISSDCPMIQAEARNHGAEVLFSRPAELATDNASILDVIRHTMEWFRDHEPDEQFDAIMLLEPSSPFATAQDYDAAVALMMRTNAKVVVGMREVEVNSMFVGELDDNGRISSIVEKIGRKRALNRQELHQEYTMNGCLYLVSWDYFLQHGVIYGDAYGTYGYVMDRLHSIEIDEMIDLHWAEFLADRGYVDLTPWT